MRILVLQLARFGDIYQTWPVLKALRRRHPEAELHVLVRKRFSDGLEGLDGAIAHHWDTGHFLEPIFTEESEVEAHRRLVHQLDVLRELNFDKIINLSFSPVSSYLTHALTTPRAEVTGYTRFADGFLAIPDDASAYFFAQGEIGRANRFHVTQIFALVAGVELCDEDFVGHPSVPRKNQVIVHLGASQSMRLYPAEKWVEILQRAMTDEEWILVGSPDESSLAQAVAAKIDRPNLINRVGKTRLPELMSCIAESRLLIGCDSAPAQIASLTQTPVLQLSSTVSNFWTTGPLTAGSRVLYAEDLQDIEAEAAAREIRAMLAGLGPQGPCAVRPSPSGNFELHQLSFDDFSWRLVEAIYTQKIYPEAKLEADVLAFQRLFEMAELAITQIDALADENRRSTAMLILKNIDQMLGEIGRLNPRVDPLIQWFETERLRMAPASAEQTFARTRQLFADLLTIAGIYRRFEDPSVEGRRAADLAKRCLPALREFRLNSVQEDFQGLISVLHELSRHSTKVGDQQWSQILGGLNEALDRRDLIEVADQLEYILIPALS